MPSLESSAHVHQVLDVRGWVHRPNDETSHYHGARGVRVDMAHAGPERVHYHRTAAGMTDPAPNRPGHRHRLSHGGYTEASNERWSTTGVGRL